MNSYWLLKTEPEEYSWEDLAQVDEATWDGVRAPAALKNIMQMQPDDLAFIYHTGKEKAIIGIAKITTFPFSDPGSKELAFNVSPLQKLPQAVTLKQIKDSQLFPNWGLVRLPRLSVVPVSKVQWDQVLQWSKLYERTSQDRPLVHS